MDPLYAIGDPRPGQASPNFPLGALSGDYPLDRCESVMKMRKFFCMCFLISWMIFLPNSRASERSASSPSPQVPSIVVGPNMLASRDGDFPHMELSVAANPRNPKNLIGAAITTERGEGGFACKTYASSDGGSSWLDSSFPEQLQFGGGDPQVGFGLHDTAYFTSLAFVKDENNNTRGGLYFYRSEDGGKTWQKPFNLGYSYDHEVMVVDHSFGRYSGQVYLSVLYGKYPEYTLGVFRSNDDGRTFTGPVDAVSGKKIRGLNTAGNILLLRDGTLVLPYIDFEFDPEKSKAAHTSHMWLTTSTDGGVSFSQPVEVNTQEVNRDRINDPGFSTFYGSAVDSSVAFPDRIYIVWSDYRTRAYRLLFSYSNDRGKTWIPARQLDPNVPEWVSQYQPAIAINRDGVVGVSWFDTRNSADHDKKQYDEYFAASVDGGETFSAPVRVSSVTSSPFGKGNVTMQADSWSYKGETRISFISAVSRWPAGGDYMGLATDREGIFHPFWADARTGTFQIQTAQIAVSKKTDETKAGLQDTAEPNTALEKATSRPARVSALVLDRVELLFDPTSYDPVAHVLEVPVRLRNISHSPVYGPITLEVTKFGSGLGNELQEFTPAILNAANHKEHEGAIFDFTPMLGTAETLEPASMSGELVLRIKLQNPVRIPDFHIALTALVPEVK